MSGTYWFDKGRVKEAVRSGVESGLDEIAERVASEARRRAPIRKVFKERKGFRRKFRTLTPAEKNLAIKRAQHYYTAVKPNEFKMRRAVAHVRYYAKVQLPRRGSANSLAASRSQRVLGYERGGRFTSTSGATRNRSGGYEPGETLGKALTSRGKYEVRSGRAIHMAASATGAQTRVQVGGALKASIGNEGVTETPDGMKATIAAAIRYAKFVEFPTIHNAAQPFLLPALHGERERLPRTLAAHIKRSLGG